jgi:hypothetical protein
MRITHLLCADDLVLLSTTTTGMQSGLDNLDQFSKDWRLELNTLKTTIVIFNCLIKESNNFCFVFSGQTLDIVSRYVYLGITLLSTGSFKQTAIDLKKKALRPWFKIKQCLCISDVQY